MKRRELEKKEFNFLALGDSYTIGESVSEKENFPNLLSLKLKTVFQKKISTKIIATTGWRTDQLIQAIETADLKNEFDFVTLLIGVNNQFQNKNFTQYQTEFVTLLNTAITLAQGEKEKVIVLSIPDYAYTPFGKGNKEISKGVDKYNAFAEKIAVAEKVDFINITDISRRGLKEPELVANDNLHISGLVYKEIATRIFEKKFKDLKTLK